MAPAGIVDNCKDKKVHIACRQEPLSLKTGGPQKRGAVEA